MRRARSAWVAPTSCNIRMAFAARNRRSRTSGMPAVARRPALFAVVARPALVVAVASRWRQQRPFLEELLRPAASQRCDGGQTTTTAAPPCPFSWHTILSAWVSRPHEAPRLLMQLPFLRESADVCFGTRSELDEDSVRAGPRALHEPRLRGTCPLWHGLAQAGSVSCVSSRNGHSERSWRGGRRSEVPLKTSSRTTRTLLGMRHRPPWLAC